MDLLKFIKEDDAEEVLNQLDLEDIASLPWIKPVLPELKAVALLKCNRPERAHDLLKSKASDPAFTTLFMYTQYKRGRFDEVVSHYRQNESKGLAIRDQMLYAQTLAKLENYTASLRIYLKALSNPESEKLGIKEDIWINLTSVLDLIFLTEGVGVLKAETKELEQLLKYLLTHVKDADRELKINTLLLLITSDKIGLPKSWWGGEGVDATKISNEILSQIEATLAKDQKPLADLAKEELSDRLAILVLRTQLMLKEQRIGWNKRETDELSELLSSNKSSLLDPQLKLSLLSFLVFISTVEKNTENMKKSMGMLEDTTRFLPRNAKFTRFLNLQTLLIKSVVLMHGDKTVESRKLLRGDLKGYEKMIGPLSYTLELNLAIQNKDFKEFDARCKSLMSLLGETGLKADCLTYLLRLAFLHKLNFQKKFSDVLLKFLREFVIPQLKLPNDQKFIDSNAFTQFVKGVLDYVIKNTQVLKALREEFLDFMQYLDDPQAAANIAEGFIDRKDFETAQKIYQFLLQRNPASTSLISRLNYIYSVIAPEKIDDSTLPNFELISDNNMLRDLENDYLGILKKAQGGSVVTQTVKQATSGTKRRIKKKIRFPKNFNFENPGPRPDPERWIPKSERSKNKRMALKKGLASKTQGATIVGEQTRDLFKNEVSTAGQLAAKAKGKRGK